VTVYCYGVRVLCWHASATPFSPIFPLFPDNPTRHMPVHTVYPLPFPSIGTARTLDVFTYGPLDSPQSVYIQASLHADELPGTHAKLRAIAIMRRL
jgi:hypothetical protein